MTLVIQTPEKLSPEAKEVLRHFDQLTGNTLNQEEPASESKGKAKKKGFMDKLKKHLKNNKKVAAKTRLSFRSHTILLRLPVLLR